MRKKDVKEVLDKLEKARSDFNTQVEQALSSEIIEVSVGAGFLIIKSNALGDILEVKVDQELYDMKDKKMLEDLIKTSIEELHTRIGTAYNRIIKKISGESIENIVKTLTDKQT